MVASLSKFAKNEKVGQENARNFCKTTKKYKPKLSQDDRLLFKQITYHCILMLFELDKVYF